MPEVKFKFLNRPLSMYELDRLWSEWVYGNTEDTCIVTVLIEYPFCLYAS